MKIKITIEKKNLKSVKTIFDFYVHYFIFAMVIKFNIQYVYYQVMRYFLPHPLFCTMYVGSVNKK
jgi:hypothetical protein